MKIIEKESFTVIGLKITIDEYQLMLEMPKLFKLFNERKKEINHFIDLNTIDITLEKHANGYTQLMCLEVSQIDQIPTGMISMTIPKQKYLYYLHQGPSYLIYDVFVSMFDYASKHNIELDIHEFKMEVYHENQDRHALYLKLI